MSNDDIKIPPCPECGQKFENVFEATDHILEDDESFDPALILPGGFKLLIGSLLRYMYEHADNAKAIQEITQSTYMTLFAAEADSEILGEMVEDMVVSTQMMDIDDELKKLLKSGE